MDVIKTIRQGHGCDEELLRRAMADPVIDLSIKELRGNLNRALTALSEDLYSKDTHFLFEFIQNADDNSYDVGVVPTLQISLDIDGRYLIIECNENGFTDANVLALCKVGASTKKGALGYIGEKGIGFKSVFKVADVVYVASNNYTFKFDRKAELGMITPIWSSFPIARRTGWTQFYLQISRSVDVENLKRQLQDVRPTHLLFLRRLHILRVETIKNGAKNISEHAKTFSINQSDLVTLTSTTGQKIITRHYIMSKKMWSMSHISEDKRKGLSETEVVLAFPINQDGTPWAEIQDVYAFLPMRSFNFKFLIQADFLTASSREDVLTDRPWNKTIRDAIISLFCESIEGFQTNENLKYAWLAYLPVGIQNPFFKFIGDSIIDKLRVTKIIHASNNTTDLPSKIRYVPKELQDQEGQPLISNRYISRFQYLSQSYSLTLYCSQIESLGVGDMTADDFLSSLIAMGHDLSSQSKDWLNRACSILCDQFRIWQRNRGYYWVRSLDIMKLPLVPLIEGGWMHSNDNKIFFKSGTADVPYDLSLRFIDEHSVGTDHRTFLKNLGIKTADASEIAKEIFELHNAIERKQNQRSTADLVKHAKFLFDHRHLNYGQLFQRVVLHDCDGGSTHGSKLYMDDPNKLPLSKVLSQPAKFVHSDYLEAYTNNLSSEWLRWLHNSLGINTVPRLENGKLSAEFREFFIRNDTEVWLKYLRNYWLDIVHNANGQTSFVEEISDTVVAIDGSDLPQRRLNLKETYLRTKVLSSFTDLPFLPILDGDSEDWSFLRQLGVSFDVDAKFSMHWLLNLDKSGNVDINTISGMYKQIYAHFNDDNGKHVKWIRLTFANSKLIYKCKGNDRRESESCDEWLSVDEVVWGGPFIMTSKIDIRRYYPELEYFFMDCLQLQPAPDDILADELLLMIDDAEGEVLDETKTSRFRKILIYLAEQLEIQDSGAPSWLCRIIDEPIFLVKDSEEPGCQPSLKRRADCFFIPDSHELREVFSGCVPLLDYPTSAVSRLQPLLRHFNVTVKNLSKAVRQEIRLPEDCQEDKLSTELLLERSDYIVRLISNSKQLRTRESKAKITKPVDQGIQVYSTNEIHKTFTLTFKDQTILKVVPDTCNVSHFVDSFRRDRFAVYKESSLDIKSPKIVKKLADYLKVKFSDLSLVLEKPLESMDELLDTMEIYSLDDDLVDFQEEEEVWMRDRQVSSNASMRVPKTVEQQAYNKEYSLEAMERIGGQSLDTYLQHPLWQFAVDEQISRISNAASVAINLSSDIFYAEEEPASPISQISFSLLDDEDGVDNNKVSNSVAVNNSIPHLATSESHIKIFDSKETTDLVGFLGERYVFERLAHNLPSFDHKNWTSELRCYAKFPAYKSISISDFFYPDTQGCMTGILYGEDKKVLWENNWPEYFIEVKATKGSLSNTFYMSDSQLVTARKLTQRLERTDSQEPPKQIYVLIRVYNLLSHAPSWKLFPDPHRLLYDGRLRISSKVAICAQSSNI